jgi:hypothetical protein
MDLLTQEHYIYRGQMAEVNILFLGKKTKQDTSNIRIYQYMYQISGYTTNQGTLSKYQDIHVPDFRIHHKLVYTKYQEYACYVTYDVPHFATHHKSEYTKYQDTLNIRIYMYQIQDTPQIRIQQIS